MSEGRHQHPCDYAEGVKALELLSLERLCTQLFVAQVFHQSELYGRQTKFKILTRDSKVN